MGKFYESLDRNAQVEELTVGNRERQRRTNEKHNKRLSWQRGKQRLWGASKSPKGTAKNVDPVGPLQTVWIRSSATPAPGTWTAKFTQVILPYILISWETKEEFQRKGRQ